MPAPHVPTDDTRDLVAELSALGFPQEVIARKLKLSRRDLARKYKEELSLGYDALHAELASTAVGLARNGDKTMLIFVLKTKFRWSERPAEDPGLGAEAIARDEDPEVSDRGEDGA